jgi:hypothetical protein
VVERNAGLGVLTRLRAVSVNGRRISKKKVVMKINVQTFERLKENSSQYGDVESYDEMIIRLIDFYEYEKEKCFIYPTKENKDKILY